MNNPLANLARVLIACNDPTVMRRLFERIAVENPEALIEAGSLEGLISETVKVSYALYPSIFSVKFVDAKAFKEAEGQAKAGYKVEAVKTIRAATKCGLKEAKDFVDHYVEHYWNCSISYGQGF